MGAATGHLRGGDDALAVEHADAVGGEVEARARPVTGDVLGVDREVAGVLQLGGGEHGVHGVEVAEGERTGREAGRQRRDDRVGHPHSLLDPAA